ncbi:MULTISPECIES: MliC family protein [unclassified Shewanella]|uniref:MliC family protein n=1 Tax=unclassified Shewanella TaxID=196818 RepID=UPI000C81C612|nr:MULTISPECIES: MliC family protein [unclassified Shewanella]MDO6776477.1 MliC family protein [Shewanella sp. 3_MG-2023]
MAIRALLLLLSYCASTQAIALSDHEVLANTQATEADKLAPAFDCQQASGEVEQLICQDSQLAQLDIQLNQVFKKSISQLGADADLDVDALAQLKAFQRGWIKGRNECWKADDIKQCVIYAYTSRLTELQIAAAVFDVPKAVQYQCDPPSNNNLMSIRVYFYNQTAIPAAILNLSLAPTADPIADSRAVTVAQQNPLLTLLTLSASGAKYQGQNVSFWTHQQQAVLSQFGQADIDCRVK